MKPESPYLPDVINTHLSVLVAVQQTQTSSSLSNVIRAEEQFDLTKSRTVNVKHTVGFIKTKERILVLQVASANMKSKLT